MTWYVLTRSAGTPRAAGRVRTPERLLYEAEADAPVTARNAWRNRIDATDRHSARGGTGAYAGAPAVRSGGRRTRPDALRMTWYVLTRRAGTPCAAGRVRTPERLLHEAEADAPVPTRVERRVLTRRAGEGRGYSGLSCGNRTTSRIDAASVSSITRRSMPMPSPAVGGRPYSSART